jgi:ssDNA-binding Zn-finger/Zn-ribbon topoisomerase 1
MFKKQRKHYAVKRIWNSPFYARCKKHICPMCGTELILVQDSKIVNSNSDESVNFDFSTGGDTYMIGNVKFIWDAFHCPACGYHKSVKEQFKEDRRNWKKR